MAKPFYGNGLFVSSTYGSYHFYGNCRICTHALFFSLGKCDQRQMKNERKRDGDGQQGVQCLWHEKYRLEHCWRNKIIAIDKSGSRMYPLIFFSRRKIVLGRIFR